MEEPLVRYVKLWALEVMEDVHVKAELGRYSIRGFSTLRKFVSFDELTFIPCTLSRVPLEGYREQCTTETVLGTRFAKKPIVLKTPITIAGMSFGALSRNAKVALGRAATRIGTTTTTGDGGMLMGEREASQQLEYQGVPSRSDA